MRFNAYGWHVQDVQDGNKVQAIDRLSSRLRKIHAHHDHLPDAYWLRFTTRQDTEKAHGEPLVYEELDGAKRNLSWPANLVFWLCDDVLDYFRQAITRGKAVEESWRKRWNLTRAEYPDLAHELERRYGASCRQGGILVSQLLQIQGRIATGLPQVKC